MLFATLQRGDVASFHGSVPAAERRNLLSLAEFIQVLAKMLARLLRIGSEELPVKLQFSHSHEVMPNT